MPRITLNAAGQLPPQSLGGLPGVSGLRFHDTDRASVKLTPSLVHMNELPKPWLPSLFVEGAQASEQGGVPSAGQQKWWHCWRVCFVHFFSQAVLLSCNYP